jgi:hypothetical protein
MKDERREAMRRRLGPLTMSLAAAAITAIGFAAVSLAQDSGGDSGNGNGQNDQAVPAPPPGAGVMMFRDRLSAEDRQKLDDFRQCMEDNGAPGPPRHIDPSNGPPKPPSAEDQKKIQKAYEACKDKLPEDMQNAGPPQLHAFGCGPLPGQSETQSQNNGTKEQQDYVVPAPQSSGSAS